MFGHYIAKFQDGTEYKLFGQDFFGDRIEFSRHHHAHLIGFSLQVCEKKRPKSIYSSYEDRVVSFDLDDKFDEWYKEHQASLLDFGFSNLTNMNEIEDEVAIRIKDIDKIFIEEIEHLRVTSAEYLFRYFYERYNELVRASKIGLKSIEVLLENDLLDKGKLEQFKEIFKSPLLKIENSETLEFYSNTAKKSISKEGMIELLAHHHKLFLRKVC